MPGTHRRQMGGHGVRLEFSLLRIPVAILPDFLRVLGASNDSNGVGGEYGQSLFSPKTGGATGTDRMGVARGFFL